MDLDDVLLDIGEFGRYQKLVLWFILLPGAFPCGFHAYNQLFMAAKPDHWCRIPELENFNPEFAKNISVPLEKVNENWKFDECLMYENDYGNFSVENFNFSTLNVTFCKHGWIYDRSEYESTVIMEWDLVCDKDFSTTLALVLFGIAGLVGNYIFGYVQDGLGRKPAFFVYLGISCVFGIVTAFAPNFFIWTLTRIGVGFTVPAILGTPCVLAIELVGPAYRTTVALLINIAYSFSLISLAIVVWLIRDWRKLAIFTTIPFLPLFCFYFVFPESPRWLISRGKFNEAGKILIKIKRINGKKDANFSAASLKRHVEEEDKRYGIYDLFRYPNLRIKTIIITFIWFTNTSVYVGLSYYAPALGGDEFLNFFLAGAVELPTYLALWPAMKIIGRRWILCVSMVLGGTACLATFLAKSDSIMTLALYCVGKMGISSSFVVLPLIASELYPTVIRGLGMSISSVMGMLGPVFIPLINHLGSDMLTLPLIIMGILLVAGGACSLLLPETLNQHLPQTLEDGEKAGINYFTWHMPSKRGKTKSTQESTI